jgi:hypothetical protein
MAILIDKGHRCREPPTAPIYSVNMFYKYYFVLQFYIPFQVFIITRLFLLPLQYCHHFLFR